MTRRPLISRLTARRARYGLWRFGYILGHACFLEAGVHGGGAIFVGFIVSLILERARPLFDWPLLPCLLPALLGLAYAAVVTVRVYRRVAEKFPDMRRRMRERRRGFLLMGGVPRRRRERMNRLLEFAPLVLITAAGFVLAITLFPNGGNRGRALIAVAGALGALVSMWVKDRADRRWRFDFRPLCPRCGYDLTGTPQRCPECGLKRLRPTAAALRAGATRPYVGRWSYYEPDDDDDDDENDEEPDESGGKGKASP